MLSIRIGIVGLDGISSGKELIGIKKGEGGIASAFAANKLIIEDPDVV